MCQILATEGYLVDANHESVRLVIMGKDPYPTRATGIPFCKADWTQQSEVNNSGNYVLRSLGIDIGVAENQFPRPQDLFESLRDEGIIFLNASYVFIGAPLRRKHHLAHMQRAFFLNQRFIESADNTILCGEAKKCHWVTSLNMSRAVEVVHPDLRNRNNPKTRERWSQWWSPCAIAKRFNLTLRSNESPLASGVRKS